MGAHSQGMEEVEEAEFYEVMGKGSFSAWT